MRSRLLAVGGLVALLATTTPLVVRAQTGTPEPPTVTPAPGQIGTQEPGTPAPARRGRRANRKERHPELMKAMRSLERAKSDLEHGARDFGGHRARAEELTEQALQEVRAAMQFDKE